MNGPPAPPSGLPASPEPAGVPGDWQLVVMAKAPVPGRVKTRLCPPLHPVDAAVLATAAIADTLAAGRATSARRVVVALDGSAWEPPEGVDVVAQCAGGLGQRLAAAVADAYSGLAAPVVVIGMDTPHVMPGDLDTAAALLCEDYEAVLGPATDGGYWLIGTRQPVPGMFDGVPMSTDTTGHAQALRLDALGLRWRAIGTMRDVDVYTDAVAVAASAPGTRFAAALGTLGSPPSGARAAMAAAGGAP